MVTKQAMRAIATGSALALGLLAIAPAAQAAALTPAQVTAVVALLQSFGVDASTVATVQSVLNGTSPAAGGSSAPSNGGSTGPATGSLGGQVLPPGQGVGLPCAPGLTANLHMGSEGEDVTRLQQFLAKDPTLFQGQATGFFGPKTEDAVRHWQLEHGIVATDTPMSNSGFVGPMTRGEMDREMEQECHTGDHGGDHNGSSTPESSNSGGDN